MRKPNNISMPYLKRKRHSTSNLKELFSNYIQLGRLLFTLFSKSFWDCDFWLTGSLNQILLVSLFGH
jgi:hypothetical protein